MLTSGEPEWKVWEKLYKIFSFKFQNFKLQVVKNNGEKSMTIRINYLRTQYKVTVWIIGLNMLKFYLYIYNENFW